MQSCSFWADGYSGILPHLKAKTGFAVIAKASQASSVARPVLFSGRPRSLVSTGKARGSLCNELCIVTELASG